MTIGERLPFIFKEISFTFADAGAVTLRPDVEVRFKGKDVLFFPMGL
jgi:hypothetical protein